jgi:uncharacterized tellurite resistance protein B-like protein
MERVTGLGENELLTLAGLLRLLVRLDGMASAAELAAIDALAVELGRERFNALIRRAANELPRDEDVEQAALRIDNPDARELIFTALFEIAAADSILQQESSLLD